MSCGYGLAKTEEAPRSVNENNGQDLIRVRWWARRSVASLLYFVTGLQETIQYSRVFPLKITSGRSSQVGSYNLAMTCHQKLSQMMQDMPPFEAYDPGDARAGVHPDNNADDVVGYQSGSSDEDGSDPDSESNLPLSMQDELESLSPMTKGEKKRLATLAAGDEFYLIDREDIGLARVVATRMCAGYIEVRVRWLAAPIHWERRLNRWWMLSRLHVVKRVVARR